MITESKNIFYENLLVPEECELFEETILNAWKSNQKNDDFPAQKIHPNTFGILKPFYIFDIPRSSILNKLENRLKKDYPQKLKFCSSFLRLYFNGSYLLIHNDMVTYDVTLSINVGGLDTWPIHISKLIIPSNQDFVEYEENKQSILIHKLKENHETFITPKGSGVACYARNSPHWREKLICNENEYVAQLFMHWSFA